MATTMTLEKPTLTNRPFHSQRGSMLYLKVFETYVKMGQKLEPPIYK